MKIQFIKMQSCGNDYIYVDYTDLESRPYISEKDIVKMSSYHYGIGADGVVILSRQNGKIFMEMFNSDGREGNICGNALICSTMYLHKERNMPSSFNIFTKAGERKVSVLDKTVSVNMGCARIVKRREKTIADFFPCCERRPLHFVDVGNPHCVIEDASEEETLMLSKYLEREGGVNVESVRIIGRKISVTVCERGSGVTLSCGSGAVAVASVLFAKARFLGFENEEIALSFKGGTLCVFKDGDSYILKGEPSVVFYGTYSLD